MEGICAAIHSVTDELFIHKTKTKYSAACRRPPEIALKDPPIRNIVFVKKHREAFNDARTAEKRIKDHQVWSFILKSLTFPRYALSCIRSG